ncbi:MAG: hypothetical protein DRQ89_12520 [Epsilonproteobacteria bacterium]|nr:MAG: hypothetical protein DRQ89_12520 [Campylobacterota bacterium]
MSKRTYYDSLFDGLIPCKLVKVLGGRRLVVEVTKTVGAYKKGDPIEVWNHRFVEKVRSIGPNIKVRTAETHREGRMA